MGQGYNLSPSETSISKVVQMCRQLLQGRSNASGSCTLATGVTSTTVTAINCGPSAAIFLFPQTAHAAAVLGTTYVQTSNVKQGSFIITHASTANTDCSFWYVCLG